MEKLHNHIHNHIRFYRALLMALLPLLCCVVRCLLTGHSIADIYLPASEWNDELFYYKQVEGMLQYGYPYGYFGFNESHALVLSFAAWSPVLLWPWLLWGLIFGWNLLSPIYCNIFVMMLAVFLFVWITKADGGQCIRITVLFVLFPLFSRYMMSAMPEITCFAMLIVYWALAYSYYQQENAGKLAGMFALSAIMTLMRPYLIVFLALPMLILIWKKKWAGLAGSLVIGGGTGILYICINHFLAAEYFTALFDVSWLTNFIHYGFKQGLQELIAKLTYNFADFFRNCYQGLTDGLATGSFFIGFLVVMALLFIYTICCLCRKAWKESILYGHLFLSFFAMWMALILMYKMQEGSKHLLTFIAVGIFALAMMKDKTGEKTKEREGVKAAEEFGEPEKSETPDEGIRPVHCLKKAASHWQVIVCALTFVYLYYFMAVDAYDYQLCFQTQELVEEMESVADQMEESMIVQTQDVPSYDNDVIWVAADYSTDGEEWLVTDYQILYSLPAGFGISCCYADYITVSFDTLQSKYLCTVAGGTIDALCQEKGLPVVAEGLNAVIYQLR
ncbi:MAG: hypothetical protein LUC95_02560 [Lachnospiraceae bacterium]|nr:hypothetical protein [Lachnospiraceae bacterium]